MCECKIIFSDIDGTLLTSDNKIGENTNKKIKELECLGIPFVLVSARMPEGIYLVQKALNIKAPIVCYSGGLVIDKENKIIDTRGIKVNKAIEVKEYIKDNWKDICCSVYSYNNWIADDIENKWIIQESEITKVIPIIGELIDILKNNQEIHKILCIGDANIINEAVNKLKEKYPELSIYKSKETYLEIMDGHANKADAVKILCDSMNIDIKNSISFGDNYNDIDMLKTTGKSYAMGNAPEEVKMQADYVTLDNNNEGIFEVLKKYSFK